MAIWMDMTNSMHVWQAGVVGIIRAELEIAKNMYKDNPSVRFFKYNGESFVEIDHEDISWLWECESVGDGYLAAMGRKQTAGCDNNEADDSDNNLDIDSLRKKYPGFDNAMNYSPSRVYRLEWGMLLYANSKPKWCRGILKGCVHVFMAPLKAVSKIRNKSRERKQRRLEAKMAKAAAMQTPVVPTFSHPFEDGDTVFSCGWLSSGKEEGFEKVKQECNIFLTYLIYDIILIRENTKQFYYPIHRDDFSRYIHWASMHCDAILYGGKTAMEDSEEYFASKNLPVPKGYPVYFGSDIIKNLKIDSKKWQEFRKSIGLKGDYVMVVGSMDERKNYGTLYRAFTILADRNISNMPQLVIVGKGGACNDLRGTIKNDPRTKETIIFTAPSDEELDWLYQNAKFILLASAWEGWSLTLPEALNYNKMVLASDVAPLREIGQSLIEYIDTYDPYAWADRIEFYMNNPKQLRACEQRIRENYKRISWSDCGKQISGILQNLDKRNTDSHIPTLYMDITLTWITSLMGGNITGILRTELMLIKYMYNKYPNIKFFALNDVWGYQHIDVSNLMELITGSELDKDFNICREKIKHTLSAPPSREEPGDLESLRLKQINERKLDKIHCKEDAYWFFVSIMPSGIMNKMIAKGKKKKRQLINAAIEDSEKPTNEKAKDAANAVYEMPMVEGDVIFTAGTGSGKETYEKLLNTKKKLGYKTCSIIYDLTPIIVPQTHHKDTLEHYTPFLKYVSEYSDLILYGGATAQHDGIEYQKKKKLPIPASYPIKFGSDIAKKESDASEEDEKKVLERLGIKKDFVMAVGTMEQRKNYETLYRAYIRLVEEYDDIPQLVFCGHPGWNANDFFGIMSNDERIEGKLIRLTPSDEELDILYRNCRFTVLASLYEGWSLTLPESMWYKKFCICCDTPALKEIAGDLSEYIPAWDEKKWAESIYFYYSNPDAVKKREEMIQKKWHAISWDECADSVMAHLKELLNK